MYNIIIAVDRVTHSLTHSHSCIAYTYRSILTYILTYLPTYITYLHTYILYDCRLRIMCASLVSPAKSASAAKRGRECRNAVRSSRRYSFLAHNIFAARHSLTHSSTRALLMIFLNHGTPFTPSLHHYTTDKSNEQQHVLLK